MPHRPPPIREEDPPLPVPTSLAGEPVITYRIRYTVGYRTLPFYSFLYARLDLTEDERFEMLARAIAADLHQLIAMTGEPIHTAVTQRWNHALARWIELGVTEFEMSVATDPPPWE